MGETSQDEQGGLHFYMHFPLERINYPRHSVHSLSVQVLHPAEHATHLLLESINPSAHVVQLNAD